MGAVPMTAGQIPTVLKSEREQMAFASFQERTVEDPPSFSLDLWEGSRWGYSFIAYLGGLAPSTPGDRRLLDLMNAWEEELRLALNVMRTLRPATYELLLEEVKRHTVEGEELLREHLFSSGIELGAALRGEIAAEGLATFRELPDTRSDPHASLAWRLALEGVRYLDEDRRP